MTSKSEFPPAVIVNLSGGIDSAYALYLALQAGCDVLVHHIRLNSKEGRVHVEQEATERILAWMDEQSLPGAYTYVETSFDYGQDVRLIRDNYVWMFFTAILLCDWRHRDRAVVLSAHIGDSLLTPPVKEDVTDDYGTVKITRRSPFERRVALVRDVAGIEPEWVWPLRHMTKAQVVQACPEGLLERCWWCRKPDHGKPCRYCKTCQEVIPALETRERMIENVTR